MRRRRPPVRTIRHARADLSTPSALAPPLPLVPAASRVPWARLADAATLLLFVAAAGGVSLLLGQDANWDLQNYHYYNPWAWVHDQRGYAWDIVAAQLQTYHNPLPDQPFYQMVREGWDPQVIAFVLAVPTGIAAFFLLKIARLVFGDLPRVQRTIAIAAAFTIGMTSGIGVGVLGTTMNEWPGAALTIAGLYVVIRSLAVAPDGPLSRGALALAGLLCGLAAGAKLTFGVFAVGLCAAIFWRTFWQPRFWWRATREAFTFGLAVLAGTAVTAGPWMWAPWTHFRNPIFPYGNIWIKSPWWGEYEAMGRPFGPHWLREWLVFPFDLAAPPAFFVTEVPYVDGRIPALYALALTAIAAALLQRVVGRGNDPGTADKGAPASRAIWQLLGIFWVASFLLWTYQSSIFRYLVPLLMLTGPLLVGLLRSLARPAAAAAGTVMMTLVLLWTTTIPDWWRIDFGPSWFNVQVPAIEKNALVLLTTDGPMSYVLPFLPRDARFLGINNSISDARRQTLMEDTIRRTIREHKGPIYSLTYPAGRGVDALLERRILIITETCLPIVTNMRTSPIEMCRVVRMPDP